MAERRPIITSSSKTSSKLSILFTQKKMKKFSVLKVKLEMNEYSSVTQNIARETKDDPITFEEFVVDSSAHPRSVMTMRRANNKPHPILVSTVISLMLNRQRDPWTRRPISDITKRRALLYSKCVATFPDYNIENLDTKDLYNRWADTYTGTCTLTDDEKELIRLEARCFLQAEDLVGIFKKYEGSGSTLNRTKSITDLSEASNWLLRKCSVVDTEFEKAYALTWMDNGDGTVNHAVIIHKIGDGFYYGPTGIKREDSAGKPFTNWGAVYPTIIHLLEARSGVTL